MEERYGELPDSDQRALVWYSYHATAFSRDFGLMPMFVNEVELEGASRRLFLHKLNMIHAAHAEINQDRIEKERKKRK